MAFGDYYFIQQTHMHDQSFVVVVGFLFVVAVVVVFLGGNTVYT